MAEVEVWSKERLMGNSQNGGVILSPKRRKSKAKVDKDPMLWGQPGHLTEEEAEVFFKFKAEVAKRGGSFRDTIYSFGEVEGETWALCRWLRARKFVYDDVITMVEEATKTRAVAKAADFYPNPIEALGCDLATYYALYPQLYSGFAKNGAPVFISKPGVLNVDAVECLTTLEGILKLHWHLMQHDFGPRLVQQKMKDPNFKRFECISILDLNHLTFSQLTSKCLAIIKEQAAIDSITYPETMCKMYIVNAPKFFATSWRMIKGWLDPRTSSKIEVLSDRKKWTERLKLMIDEEELPSDYGGRGPDTQETIENENFSGKLKKLDTKVLHLRSHGSVTYEVAAGEEVEVQVHTRSQGGAKFTITDVAHSHAPWVASVDVQHTSSNDADMPTHVTITKEKIPGPQKLKVKCDSSSGRLSSQTFLVSFHVYRR